MRGRLHKMTLIEPIEDGTAQDESLAVAELLFEGRGNSWPIVI